MFKLYRELAKRDQLIVWIVVVTAIFVVPIIPITSISMPSCAIGIPVEQCQASSRTVFVSLLFVIAMIIRSLVQG